VWCEGFNNNGAAAPVTLLDLGSGGLVVGQVAASDRLAIPTVAAQPSHTGPAGMWFCTGNGRLYYRDGAGHGWYSAVWASY
jgi:hypothetical protein